MLRHEGHMDEGYCGRATGQAGPHVVTPEMARKANELQTEAHRSFERGMALQRQVDGLERLKEAAWDEGRYKQDEARKLLLGPRSY